MKPRNRGCLTEYCYFTEIHEHTLQISCSSHMQTIPAPTLGVVYVHRAALMDRIDHPAAAKSWMKLLATKRSNLILQPSMSTREAEGNETRFST